MCGGKVSWNAVACPHCGDPGQQLRAKLRREEHESNVQKGFIPESPTFAQNSINGVFNTIIGIIILGVFFIGFYLMSRLF